MLIDFKDIMLIKRAEITTLGADLSRCQFNQVLIKPGAEVT